MNTDGSPFHRWDQEWHAVLLGQYDLVEPAYPQHTASSSQPVSGSVTVIHPYHPLYGQQVEIIQIRRGADPDLIVRLPSGLHVAIAMSWTNYARAPDEALPTGAPHLLAISGLRQVAQLIAQLPQAGSSSITDQT